MKMTNGLEMSSYKNGNGETVTLYKNKAGNMATVVCDEVTMYNKDGDLICGARDEDSAIQLLLEWV